MFKLGWGGPRVMLSTARSSLKLLKFVNPVLKKEKDHQVHPWFLNQGKKGA